MNKKPFVLSFAALLLNSVIMFAQQPDTIPVSYRRPLFDFDPSKPTFKLSEEQLSNKNRFLRMSVITGYREGVDPIAGLANFTTNDDKEAGTRRIYMYNLSIQDILTYGFYTSNAVVLEVKDPSRYRYDPSQGSKYEWMRKNARCFELILPIGVIKSAKVLHDELCRVFGIKMGREKRMVDVLVLIRTSKIDKMKSLRKGKPYYNQHGVFNNINIDGLSTIVYKAGLPPLIDETGYKDPVDLELNTTTWSSIEAMRKDLQRYDLDLKKEKRQMEMFVITELK